MTIQILPNETKTKPKKCHAPIVLDRSGSMVSICTETIGACNDQIALLKKEGVDIPTFVSLYPFSTFVDDPLYVDRPVEEIPPITKEDYIPNGMTSMLDAVGKAIDDCLALPDADDPDTVFLMAIISDGLENNSKNENWKSIAEKIQACKATGRWTFAYLGANQDLSVVSAQMGLNIGDTMAFTANADGVAKGSTDTSKLYAGVYSAYRDGSRGLECSYASTQHIDVDEELGKIPADPA